MPKQDLFLADVVENFHTYSQTCKSDQTCEWYEQRLGVFTRWLEHNLGCEPILADFNLDSYRRYVVFLKSKTERVGHNTRPRPGGLSPHTIIGYQRALRTLASFLAADRYTEHNLLADEKPSRRKQKQPEILTEEEQADLLSSFDLDEPVGFRNHAIIFLSTGLRNNELCGLTLQSVHIDGKGQP